MSRAPARYTLATATARRGLTREAVRRHVASWALAATVRMTGARGRYEIARADLELFAATRRRPGRPRLDARENVG